MSKRYAWATAALGALLSTSQTAAADDPDYVVQKEALGPDDKKVNKRDGVAWRINSGATFNLTNNSSVIGQIDGSTLTFGFKLDGGVDWRDGDHEIRLGVNLGAGVTRTPAIDDFTKSNDALEASAIYLYHFNEWFGAFGRFAWATQMFRGTDVRSGPTNYAIALSDGGTASVLGNRLTLTDALAPARLKQSLGLFAQPISSDPVSVEIRAGGGARETLADQQLAINDDAATADVVEVKQLVDVFQVGAELVAEVRGVVYDNKLSYFVSAEAMMPFAFSDLPVGDTRSAAELTNVEFNAGLSLKVVEWASLDYTFKAIREPQLLDKFQVQNVLLLTLGVAAGSAPLDEPVK